MTARLQPFSSRPFCYLPVDRDFTAAAHIDCEAKAHLSFRVSPSGCGDLKLNELLDLRLLYGDTVAGERGLMCTDRVSHQGHLDGVITSPLKISGSKLFPFVQVGCRRQRSGVSYVSLPC